MLVFLLWFWVVVAGGGILWLLARRLAAGENRVAGPPDAEADTAADLLAGLPGMAYRGPYEPRRPLSFVSTGCLLLLGRNAESLAGGSTPLADLIHPEDREAAWQQVSAAVERGLPYRITYRVLTPRGERWVLDQGRGLEAAGDELLLEGFVADFNERKEVEQRLLHEALHDRLTNLPSRVLFADRLRRAVMLSEGHEDGFVAVLSIDLDRFKAVNDRLGHHEGDRALILTARRLETLLGPRDALARLGSNEFGVLLDGVEEPGDAVRLAARIDEVIRLPLFLTPGEEVFLSASIGIASSLSTYEEPDDLLRDAELAMYRAKALGGARHELFDPVMHARAVDDINLETDMRRALTRDEFFLLFQPIAQLDSGDIRGFEALLRWDHPERGLLGPAEFLPLASDSGLTTPIAWWVLRRAAEQIAEWQRRQRWQEPLFVSINMSGSQFTRADLIDKVRATLQDTGISPESLIIEITEGAVMMDTDPAIGRSLAALDELGVGLALDDFGTGYSSLAYISRLPIRTVKIDRSFTTCSDGELESREIVHTIVDLAHRLEMDVVAEGIEDFHQLEALRALGCDYGQGFLFSEPLSAAEIETLFPTTDARDWEEGLRREA